MLTLIWRSRKSWSREKGVALLALLALAIGIGSATAIFTIVEAVLFRPLPYSQGERWVALLAGDTRDPKHFSGLSYQECTTYQEQIHSFEMLGCYPVGGDFNLTSPGAPQHLDGIDVSPGLIAETGAIPMAGRLFSAADGPNVALISRRLFARLGAGIIGHPVTLNGQPYLVVGAMPAWFRLPIMTVYGQNSQNDVWIPLKKPVDEDHARNYAYYEAYAKLKPGVEMAHAKAEVIALANQIRKQNHPNTPTYTAAFFSLQDSVVNTIRPILLLLFGAAGLLLLITCANVAGLLVSRSVGRARETAICIALGGSRSQLAAKCFLESLWVSLPAAVAGMVASGIFVRMLVALGAGYIPRSQEVATNWTAVWFAILLAFLTATLSALAPVWQAFRTPPSEVLSNGVRASAGVRSRRLSQGLVIGEIALAFTLICAGALLLWQFRTLNQTSPGFNPNGVVSFQLSRSGDAEQTAAYANNLVSALESIPGVANAAVTNQVPLDGCCYSTSLSPERRATGIGLDNTISLMIVSPGYFKTLGIPLLAGRLLNVHDTDENLTPVVIDEAAASRYWRNQNAVGETARLAGQNGSRVQVVGVVGTVRNQGLGKAPTPELYLTNKRAPLGSMHFVVRSSLSTNGVASAIRRAVSHVDATQPIFGMESMKEIIDESLVFQKLEWIVITFFALAALVMACLGVYSLTSYSVRQRTTEIGTRMALGATDKQVIGLVTGDGLRLSCYGILIGALTTVAATELISRYFDIHSFSAVPYLVSVIAVVAFSLLASLVPAWRASIISPMAAIRNDTESIWESARRSLQQARERILGDAEIVSFDATLLTEFIEASRRADSFAEAYRALLGQLCTKLDAESALLLEKMPAGEFRCLAAVPDSKLTVVAIPDNGFLLNRLKFYGSPMSFTAADLKTCLRWALSQKPERVGEIELLQAIGLRLAAPLRTKNDLIGLLLFDARNGGVAYSALEKNLVAVCAEQFALTVANARLNERVLEQEKVRRDIALATEVQMRLLPESSPQTAATSFGAYTLAARSVGGDYYDFLQVGDRRIGIALADIAGKGIAAALVMAVVQASLRIISSEENISLPELAAKMNRFLHRSTGFSSYATFFYAQLDEEKRQLRYVNAGHNPPYLIRADSVRAEASQADESAPVATIEELATGGMIIGMFPSANYEEAVVDLHAGDVLVAFTDGVTEALNTAEEEYGDDRLKELVRRVAHLPVPEMTSSIAKELRDWIGEASQHDDLTFIVMKVSD